MDIKRINQLQEILKKNNVDAILIAPSEEMDFLIGVQPYLCERFHAFVITKDNGCFDICNVLSRDEMRKALPDNIPVYSWLDGEDFAELFNKACEEHNLSGKTLAVDKTVRAFNLLALMEKTDNKFIDGRNLILEMTDFKNEDELKKMKASAELADSVFSKVLEFIKPGIVEKDISSFMENIMIEGGATDTFVLACVGENTSYPHYNEDTGVVKSEDIVLLDWGCRLNGYWSDISRTIFVGSVTDEQRKAYNIVKEAQQNAIDHVRENITAGELDSFARNIIKENGYGEYFTTRLGHGIGTTVHEGPFIVSNSKQKLKENMCFTIEPGVYLAGDFGIRIEDSVTLGKDGVILFNDVNKDLTII